VSSADCVGVGEYYNGTGNDTLIESFNGTTWTITSSPNPGSVEDTLNAVSCTTVANCQTVGLYDNGSLPVDESLVESGNSGAIAYVADCADDAILPIDLATNETGAAIAVGSCPEDIAISPDGDTAFVSDSGNDRVSVVDLTTETVIATVDVGATPSGIAVAPDGEWAYVANIDSNTVTPINTVTDKAGPAITVTGAPYGIAITPNGTTALVTSTDDGASLVPINLSTNVAGTPIALGSDGCDPNTIAITPNGATAYVTNYCGSSVTPVDLSTDTAEPAITLASNPWGLALTPNSQTLYAAIRSNDTVVPITTSTNTAQTPIDTGTDPWGVAASPEGSTVYVTDDGANDVTPIATATNTTGATIPVGSEPEGIAISPDQAPEAAVSVTPAPAESPTSFNASASVAPTSPIASYAWNFGDGHTETTSSPTTTHTYASGGTYTATVTETDQAGTSTTQVFTGETVSNNGSSGAEASQSFTVIPCNAGESCSGTVSNSSQTSTITGTSSTTGTLSLSIGSEPVTCGSTSAEDEQVTSFSTTNFSAPSLQATMTVKGVKKTKGFEACYSSATAFTDAQGDSVYSGELADCSSNGDTAPCLVSDAISGTNLVATLSVLPGDPRFWEPDALASFTPDIGGVGTSVVIKGGPFAGTSQVAFNGIQADFTVNSAGTKITAQVPKGAKTGLITVIAPDGQATSSTEFTVRKNPAA
jgi:YVTN family beta-propeller protein